MTKLLWDQTGERRYENGVNQGVLYLPTAGVYSIGYAWNGLTSVTESPSGAEATPQYADNRKYLNMVSAEDFSATLEAFTYPEQFTQCDGTATPQPGVYVGQQNRKTFGLSYKTLIGTDVNPDAGYKLHLVYGALAAPTEKSYATVNDSPEAATFSWEMTTTQVDVTGLKPTAILTIDSTKVAPANLLALENALYGTVGTDPRLPLPDEVIAMFAGSLVATVMPTQPTFVSTTGVITIPSVTGIDYRRGDTQAIVTGTTTIAGTTGASLVIYVTPKPGYYFPANADDDWTFVRTA